MNNLIGEKFVVTGADGFIGSHIAEELVKQGKQVILIDNSFDDGWVDCEDPADSYRLDFNSSEYIKRVQKKWPWINNDQCKVVCQDVTRDLSRYFNWVDVVFHQACSKCTVCRDNPIEDLMTNAWGAFNVFDAARQDGAKVVHASTGSVYGDNATERFKAPFSDELIFKTSEKTKYAPKSFYGVSKLAGEQYLRAFKEYYGLRFVGLRYFHVFGPHQDAGPKGGVVAIFITRMLKGEPITIFGDGNQTRSFTYVKDVVNANFHAANSKEMEGKYFNVASGVSVSLNELVEVLSEIMDVKPTVEYKPVRLGDIKDFNVSNDMIRRHGFSEWSDFKDALQETVRWYRGYS